MTATHPTGQPHDPGGRRYADPVHCPDCGAALSTPVRTCPVCRLPLDTADAQAVLSALHAADQALDRLRAERRRRAESTPSAATEAPARAGTAAPPVVRLPAHVSSPDPAAPTAPTGAATGPARPTRPARRGLAGVTVPRLLFTLAVLSLLLGAAIFMAVTWTRLGVGLQTLVLLTVTLLAGAGSLAAVRVRLRGAAESTALVAAGLAGLDAYGAATAGWFGPPPGGSALAATVTTTVSLAGVLLLVLGRRVKGEPRPSTPASRRPPLPVLVTPQLALGVGAVLALWAWSGSAPHGGGFVVAGGALGLGVGAHAGARVSLRPAAACLGGGAVASALAVLAEALVTLGDATAGAWVLGQGPRLVLVAAALGALAATPARAGLQPLRRRLGTAWRVAAAAGALTLVPLALAGPALARHVEVTAGLAALTALALAALALGDRSRPSRPPALPEGPWRAGARLATAPWVVVSAVPVVVHVVVAVGGLAALGAMWSHPALVGLDPGTLYSTGLGLDPHPDGVTVALLAVLLLVAPVLLVGALATLTTQVGRGTRGASLRAGACVLAVTTSAWLLLSGAGLLVVVVGWTVAGVALSLRSWLPGLVAAALAVLLSLPSAVDSCVALAGAGAAVALVLLRRPTPEAAGAPIASGAAGGREELRRVVLLTTLAGVAIGATESTGHARLGAAAHGPDGGGPWAALVVALVALVLVVGTSLVRRADRWLTGVTAALVVLAATAAGVALDGRADALVGALGAAVVAAVVGGAGLAVVPLVPRPGPTGPEVTEAEHRSRLAAGGAVALASLVPAGLLLTAAVDLVAVPWLVTPVGDVVGGGASPDRLATVPCVLVTATLAALPWLRRLGGPTTVHEATLRWVRHWLARAALLLGAAGLAGAGLPRGAAVAVVTIAAAVALARLVLGRLRPAVLVSVLVLVPLALLGSLADRPLALLTLATLGGTLAAVRWVRPRALAAADGTGTGAGAGSSTAPDPAADAALGGAWAAGALAVPLLVTVPGISGAAALSAATTTAPGLLLAGPVMLVAAALTVVACAARWRRPVPGLEAVVASSCLVAGLMSVSVAREPALVAALELLGGGVLVAAHAAAHASRRWAGWVASALVTAGSWLLLHRAGVSTPEAYTLPLATGLLLHGWWLMRRDPALPSSRALAAGLWLALLPSLWLVLDEPLTLRAALLGAGCLVAVLLGVRLRLSQPLLAGALGGLALLVREATPWLTAGPRWVPFVLAGLVLGAVALTWEARLTDVRRAAAYVGRLR
ncbi:hypothetical protein [Nocardioides sp. GY 10127]|uniref:SCO7613 C-terminal domain-containing membrane protein n=1 Tax=Nocardioides sp. GY 10127 TaxID=2569762 RepID=UPI0010A767F4|nr:hypothetical protein [Nocardioides sp. GY 10127]TIC82831.1 hypothetical protein E8D37_09175 [Nocardioides sp. GY 10127]